MTHPAREFGGVKPSEDLSRAYRSISLAFGYPEESAETWIANAGLEHLRIARSEGQIEGTVLRIPMGIHLGGVSVPMVGIAGVTVVPERRGCGVAGFMMRETVRELHAEGVPVSGLFSAMHPLYRKAGYEHAGTRFRIELPLALIRRDDRGAGWREADWETQREAIESCASAFAARHNGMLDRGDYIWNRIAKPRRGGPVTAFVREHRGEVIAYVFLRHTHAFQPAGILDTDIEVMDLAWRDVDGLRAIEGLLAGFSSVSRRAIIHGGPTHALVDRVGDRRYGVSLTDVWMLRLISVSGALTARRYMPGLSIEVHLRVHDDVVPENDGCWVLRISDGEAACEPGGTGDVEMHVRTLASLFTGYRAATAAHAAAEVAGDVRAIGALDAVFAGPPPWCPDMY